MDNLIKFTVKYNDDMFLSYICEGYHFKEAIKIFLSNNIGMTWENIISIEPYIYYNDLDMFQAEKGDILDNRFLIVDKNVLDNKVKCFDLKERELVSAEHIEIVDMLKRILKKINVFYLELYVKKSSDIEYISYHIEDKEL